MRALHRMIDANVNRAGEALRVIEDVARFALHDQPLTASAKALRHRLRGVITGSNLRHDLLESNRAVHDDPGTGLTSAAESRRAGMHDVAAAAGKRLGEALRVLEEAFKLVDDAAAAHIKAMRYDGYTLGAAVLARLGSSRVRQWALCLLLTRSLCRLPWEQVVLGSIDGGADCIQVREKHVVDADVLRHVRDVITLAKPRGAAVIVNDRVDLALASEADGVHLGAHDLPLRAARQLAGRTLIIGATVHTLDEAHEAIDAGADYCGVGAMFATARKPDRTPAGPPLLADFIARFPSTPHLAIGGIAPGTIGLLAPSQPRGVAVCGALCSAEHPRAVAAELVNAMHERRE